MLHRAHLEFGIALKSAAKDDIGKRHLRLISSVTYKGGHYFLGERVQQVQHLLVGEAAPSERTSNIVAATHLQQTRHLLVYAGG
jgi:hypothetical protein